MNDVTGKDKVGHFADVSQHQSGIDWSRYAKGHPFVVIKATEGRTFTDPTFKDKLTRARKAGLIVGAYHFARPDNGNPPRAEAANFVQACRASGMRAKGRREHLADRREVFVLDYERRASGSDGAWVGAFLDEFKTRTGIKREEDPDGRPGPEGLWLYGYGSSLGPVGSPLGMPVWFAAYVNDWRPFYPSGWDKGRVFAWQHTNGQDGPTPHRLEGLAANHDVNVALRDATVRDLRKLAA